MLEKICNVLLLLAKWLIPYKMYLAFDDVINGILDTAEDMTPDWSAYDIGRVLSFMFILALGVFNIFLIVTILVYIGQQLQ